MEWDPTASAEVTSVATPPAESVPVPSTVAPSLKVIEPVGVAPAPVTVAVSVTDWPKTAEAFEVPSVVVLVVEPVVGPADVARSQLKLPKKPVPPLVSKTTFSRCVPDGRVTPVLVMVAQFVQ